MKVVFNGSYFESMNVRNLLEGAEIKVFVQNEYMSTIEPWVVTSGGLNPVKLQVNDDDFEQAESIIKNYLDGNNIEYKN
jgi:Putative prokaryotic signal transducing protein